MAVYEFKCEKCEEVFEENFPIGEAPKKHKCPKCGVKCRRIFSPPMIQFIGPGFYVNDSKGSQGSEG